MSTNSYFGIQKGNKVLVTRVHWDGGLWEGGVGQTLLYHYSDARKIEKVIKLGWLSVLGPTPEECSAYIRDWGRLEDSNKPFLVTLKWYRATKDNEYAYLWNGTNWEVAHYGFTCGTVPWMDLEAAIAKHNEGSYWGLRELQFA